MPHHDRYLFTSESVSMGHPDKMADQISDGILDAILQQDPYARVACESLLTTGLVCLAGEITTKAMVDYPAIVRQIVRDIGYTSSDMGFDASTCAVMVALGKQSPDIAQGVNEDSATGKDIGAGDQGMMFGFACNDTEELMPLPIALAHRIINRITELRQNGTIPWLRPDAKSQVTIEYDGFTPIRVDTVVVSTQHAPDVSHAEIVKTITEQVIVPVLPTDLINGSPTYHINPTGKFVIGGPARRFGSDGPQDHRRHLWRDGPARRRCLQRQRPHKGRPLGRLHGSLRRQEHRGLPPGGAVRDPARLCHRRLRAGQRPRRYPGNRDVARLADRRVGAHVTSGSTRRASSSTLTCGGRSTARRPAAATSAARSPSSPGKRPTRPTSCAKRPIPLLRRRLPE